MPRELTQYIAGTVAPGVQIEGLEETIEALNELPKTLVLAGFTGALQKAADVLMEEVNQRVPIRLSFSGGSLSVEGGDLKGALMSEVTLDSNYRGGVAEVGFGNLGYIANMVEYGHRMISHGGKELSGPKTPGGFVQAYPFMRPAFDSGRERAIDAFVASIQATVKQYKAKYRMPQSVAA